MKHQQAIKNAKIVKEQAKQWIHSDNGIKTIRIAAILFYKNQRLRPLLKKVLLNDYDDIEWESRKETIVHDIMSVLADYILTTEKIQTAIVSSSDPNPVRLLYHSSKNHWIDTNRNLTNNFPQYLRKRIIDILQKSDYFFVDHNKIQSLFTMAEESRNIARIFAEDLTEICFPLEKVESLTYDKLKNKKTILYLLEYFWKAVKQLWENGNVWIDVDDFVRWFNLHVSSSQTDDHVTYETQILGFDSKTITKWADIFCERLNDKEKTIFFHHHCMEKNLEEVAVVAGYKATSSVSYHMDKVKYKMRFFLRDLPVVSANDYNPSAFEFFLDRLCFFLKKIVSAPYWLIEGKKGK